VRGALLKEIHMADIRLFTKPGCPYCVDAKTWLEKHGCAFDVLDITKDVAVLREWRDLSGGVGVPVLAHGRDLVIGFSPERYDEFLTACRHTTSVDPAETEAQLRA
jgi:glutaredoxin